jgi:hypothetical protein
MEYGSPASFFNTSAMVLGAPLTVNFSGIIPKLVIVTSTNFGSSSFLAFIHCFLQQLKPFLSFH